jgi:hypothetical protein
MGVDYKAYYNGRSYSSTSATYHDSLLILNGTVSSEFNDIDPHDVWHSRLHKVVSSEVLNKPVDEGTAYLYGGSWGLTWEDILRKFKAFAAADPNADWLTLYNESTNFDEKAKYPLNVDFAKNLKRKRNVGCYCMGRMWKTGERQRQLLQKTGRTNRNNEGYIHKRNSGTDQREIANIVRSFYLYDLNHYSIWISRLKKQTGKPLLPTTF